MDAGGAKGKAKSDINVTPLIDIVLVLLIVFIVMVPGLTKAANVLVPQVITTTNPPKIDESNPPVVISVTQDGKFMLQSKEVEISTLKDELVPVIKLMPLDGRKIFLKVDEDMKFQYAVDALDQVRMASEQVKKDTAANPSFNGFMGSDTKVAISIKKRN
jgi:biopolymer transport protein ExbD